MSRIEDLTVYLKEEFPGWTFVREECETVKNTYAPLQRNYGESYDCSLTTIAAIIYDLIKRQTTIENIYVEVEKVAKKRLYNGKIWGTPPVFVSNIYNTVAKKFKIPARCRGKYLKDIGFNFDMIKSDIDNNLPVILNIYNDGRNYYEKHTVKIIGYRVLILHKSSTGELKKLRMLKVYDNWRVTPGYIDYDKMSKISSINRI